MRPRKRRQIEYDSPPSTWRQPTPFAFACLFIYPGSDFPFSAGTRAECDAQRIVHARDGDLIFRYFIKIVPTVYKPLSGTITATNQYSVTEYNITAQASHGSLPTVFFIYDFSPIAVTVQVCNMYILYTSFLNQNKNKNKSSCKACPRRAGNAKAPGPFSD